MSTSEIDMWKPQVVAKANALQKVLSGDFAQVETIVRNNDLVIGVWQDPTEEDGVGTYIVKGRRALMDVVATSIPADLTWTAIPCICLEQAVALQRVCGDPNLS